MREEEMREEMRGEEESGDRERGGWERYASGLQSRVNIRPSHV